jgi:glucose-6-phosphate 1-dehydrogenase
VPALFNLHRKGRLPSGSRIVGFAGRAYDHEEFRRVVREGVKRFSASSFEKATWEAFAANLYYVRGDLTKPGDYERLRISLRSWGIHLRFETKVPDTVAKMRSVDMMSHYEDTFEFKRIPDAYEYLLLDVLLGDATFFIRDDVIELS